MYVPVSVYACTRVYLFVYVHLVYVSISIYLYLYIHFFMYIYTCIYIHFLYVLSVAIFTSVVVSVSVPHLHLYLHTHTYIYIHTYIHIFIQIYNNMFVYIHTYAYIYTCKYMHVPAGVWKERPWHAPRWRPLQRSARLRAPWARNVGANIITNMIPHGSYYSHTIKEPKTLFQCLRPPCYGGTEFQFQGPGGLGILFHGLGRLGFKVQSSDCFS